MEPRKESFVLTSYLFKRSEVSNSDMRAPRNRAFSKKKVVCTLKLGVRVLGLVSDYRGTKKRKNTAASLSAQQLKSTQLGHRLASDHLERALHRAISGHGNRVRHGVCVHRELLL